MGTKQTLRTPLRIYLSWPKGPKDEEVCHLVAAHRDLVLLRLDSLVDESVLPLLRRLPQCMEYDPDLGRPMTSNITLKMLAELWVLRSSSSCCHDDDAENWEKKRLPILYQEDDYYDLWSWDSNGWFPSRIPCSGRIRKELYRSLCVTDGGCRLVFVDVARHDGTGLGPMASGTGLTMTFRTLKMTGDNTMPWEWMDDAVITSAELWAANTSEYLPRKVMMLPLVSIDMPNIVQVVLYGWEIESFSLVTIDASDKQVLGSSVTYIKSSKEGLCTDDADLVRVKPGFFSHFLPSEFPEFLNLNR
ncbi:hypothetical protein GQ55_2G120400 [Panicum hallii var. hallii]|uniref:DUF1618 domain-containing protein n=1 Tax=Panicum hallii var. hallii TaxID=1504633 RepID=A0A2T7EP11_9POAL|nr:hypothetical protein GQ55_2G120400 [Panicum hallii var. hallii]